MAVAPLELNRVATYRVDLHGMNILVHRDVGHCRAHGATTPAS